MKLSLNWLKDFIQIKETPEKLAERFTLAGIEVEKIEILGEGLDTIVVGEIKTIVKHPAADKLQIAKVHIGKGKVLSIVCGAPNIKIGQKVPTALIGTTLPNGMVIEHRPIRGVDSEGMLCAEDELGLGDDHNGIVILPADATVGQKFTKAAALHDVVFDLALTPQRADLFSVYGLARELSALTQMPLRSSGEVKQHGNGKPPVTLRVADRLLCPRYVAKVVTGIKHTPTPQWMMSRLKASGVRPINLIVDVTNYVMIETGQPLHAFDFEKLSGGKKSVSIQVRRARKEETLITLDTQERHLDSSMLVIADAKRAVAIAGVMGGKDTEVDGRTSSVIIESAIFSPSSVRKTSQRLGLRSEASLRFEKGIAWDLPIRASERVAELLQQIGGAKTSTNVESSGKASHSASIILTVPEVTGLLGVSISTAEMKKSLEWLGCVVTVGGDTLTVTPPPWRFDVAIGADIIEEIGRMHGFNSFPATKIIATVAPAPVNPLDMWSERTRDALSGFGFSEALTYSFYGAKDFEPFGSHASDHYEVANPIDSSQQYLRISLLPKVIQAAGKNFHTRERVELFEIGKVFHESSGVLPHEQTTIAAVSLSKTRPFYRLKGACVRLLTTQGVKQEQVVFSKIHRMYARTAATVAIHGNTVGEIVLLNEQTLAKCKIRGEAAAFEISLDECMRYFSHRGSFRALTPFPAVERDLSFIVPPEATYANIESLIRGADPLIINVRGFDRYPVEDKKSVAIHIVIQSAERTLTSSEVDVVMQKIENVLTHSFDVTIRKA
ncbi:MAG: phenylalanine--tRNA ligase subunit beta [Parcubacteria group bacterium]